MPLPRPIDTLPEPDESARAHSARVAHALRVAIGRSGGWLSFERYMQLVLYAPGLGYYMAGTRKFGADGDFVTAPELTPLFGETLVGALVDVLRYPDAEVLELGAGSGALAASVLSELGRRGLAPARYRILEISPELRRRQRERLQRDVPSLVDRVVWEATLPATLTGAIVMNEVLDAVPVHVVARRDGGWFERGVTLTGDAFAWADRALDAQAVADRRLIELASGRFPPSVDYVSELNPAAEALVESLGRALVRGRALIADYGFEREHYYHPQRDQGTLIAHYRHRAVDDPFLWPGLADLTAHVDFTAVGDAALRTGLHVDSYATQARFLIEHGIAARLAAVGPAESLDYVRAASAVQTLLSPAEMGELFKVMTLSR